MITRPYGEIMVYDMKDIGPLFSFPSFNVLIGNICDEVREAASAASCARDRLSFCHCDRRSFYFLFLTEGYPYTTYAVI